MKLKITFLYAVICLMSCRVVLVPEYSAVIEDQIVNGAKMNDKLYIELQQADKNKRQFDLYADKYATIEAEINSIQMKNETRRKNEDMLVIIKNLKGAFGKYRTEHKTKNTITDGEAIADQAFIKGFWKPLLIAEGGLKNAKNVKNSSN